MKQAFINDDEFFKSSEIDEGGNILMKSKSNILFIVRHAKTKLNNDEDKSKDRIRGWKDVPLDEEGHKQSIEIGKHFKEHNVGKIYSSDLSRAMDTAEEIGKVSGVKVTPNKSFRPWHLGTLEGEASVDVHPRLKSFVEQHPDSPVAQGESMNSFKNRFLTELKKVITEWQKGDNDIVIVTHYRGLKLIEAWLKKGNTKNDEIDEKEFLSDSTPTGSIMEIQKKGNKLSIVEHKKIKA